jgi:hypothetical protein
LERILRGFRGFLNGEDTGFFKNELELDADMRLAGS